MKILKKLLLINWHYFTHEKIEFEQLNFMTGVNASGKSTIIDALQLVLLGDTSGSYFNKSASGKSSRTLKSYLCGEIRDDDKDGFKYLRSDRFTSYLVVEFYDDVKDKYFSFGCCFDVYSENDISKRFFRYNGQIPENDFIQNKVPFDITSLREFLKSNYENVSFYDTGHSYRAEIYASLGGLREKFEPLLKKAVSFNPDSNIQKFIAEFVCENEQSVDVSIMQDNIRSYKTLEQCAEELNNKKTSLENISREFNELQKNIDNKKTYEYLIDKSDIELCKENIDNLKKNAEKIELEIANIKEKIDSENANNENLQKEHESLLLQRNSDTAGIERENLNREITELNNRIAYIKKDFDSTVSAISASKIKYEKATFIFEDKYKSIKLTESDDTIISKLNDLIATSNNLNKKYEAFENITFQTVTNLSYEGFNNIIDLIRETVSLSNHLYSTLVETQKSIYENIKSLENEKNNLERGIFKFPQNSLDLKNAIISEIKSQTGKNADVVIVAEASEIKDDRWRNAIEGYLNTQKFYIVVPPIHIKTAIRVFDKIKREKSVYDTGIIDIEKLKQKNYTAEPNSLATEIETDNQNVRIYLDFILGRVIKCDDVDQIRKNRISITDEGLLYKNFVVRALNPELWKKPAIGQNAIKKRLQAVSHEISTEKERSYVFSTLKIATEGFKALDNFSKTDIERFINSAENMSNSDELHKKVNLLTEKINSLDISNFIMLDELVNKKKNEIDESSKLIRRSEKQLGSKEREYEELINEKIPTAENELEVKETNLASKFEQDWIESAGEIRYMQELSKRSTAKSINDAFPRELSKSNNAIEKHYKLVTDLRQKYNYTYKMGYDTNSYDNTEYENALKEINENQLPDYLSRIEDTRKKTMEEFQEEFLGKLANNIRQVKKQIEELNFAISSATFGEDTYRFKIEPNPDYKRYYDMITDEMLLFGGYDLFSFQFNEKYKQEIDELFSIITGGGNTTLDQSDYEKRIRTFTDYRTYLTFDIEVENRDGEVQRLSKTIGKKSGGETQTPFYIAVLASFAQLYRIGRDKKANTARLIIFDEAFSKMDGERIEKSISLLRKLGFQVILSTPTDKAGDIATKVDRVLLVLRKGKKSAVVNFDKTRIGELIYD